MKKKYIVLFILLFVFGLILMLIPYIMNYNNSKDIDNSIKNYKDMVVDNSSLIKEAKEYNKELTNTKLVDSFTDENFKVNENYNKILNLDNNGMMGYIEIPKIGVKLPIYHTTNSDVMEKGAGHEEGTSFPVGGKGTHAVIAAHRGLPSSKLFTDLNLLKEKDVFYIHILDKKLAYEVNQIKTVKPSEITDIKLKKDKDYVTLITCTPYSINTHRLLVRGERIPLTGDGESIKKVLSLVDIIFYGSIIIVISLFGVFVYIVIKNRKKKPKKKKNKKKKTTKTEVKKVKKKEEKKDKKEDKDEDLDVI